MREGRIDSVLVERGSWVLQAGVLAALACACLLAVASPGRAQTFDDTEAQLRIRQIAGSVAADQREVEDLNKAIATERARVVATPDERELNQETLKTLEKNLKAAEAKLQEHQTALTAAQEARRKGLAADADKRQREDQERIKVEQDRLKAEEEKRRQEALKTTPPPPPPPTITDDEPTLTLLDRQKLQVALAAQGYDPGPPDGQFGPRTRQMIAAWQRSRSEPATGFFTKAQYQFILQASAVAIQRFERELAAATAPPPPNTTPPPSTTPGGGENFHVTNNCKFPVRFFIRYRNTSDEWKTVGWWTFTPNQQAFLATDNVRLVSRNSIWYYYGEITTNTTYTWSGDHNVNYNGKAYKMRQREDKQGTNKLTLTCTNL